MIKADKFLALTISVSAILAFGLTFPNAQAEPIYPPAHLSASALFAPAGPAAVVSTGSYYRPSAAREHAVRIEPIGTFADVVSISPWYRGAN